MAGPTTASLDDDIRELRASIEKVIGAIGDSRIEAARNHAELASEVRNIKGIGRWVLTVGLAILAGLGSAIWWASRIDYRVAQVEVHQTKGAK